MKDLTILNNIDKLVDKMDYKAVYIEIDTGKDRYVIEKNKARKIGFSGVAKNDDIK